MVVPLLARRVESLGFGCAEKLSFVVSWKVAAMVALFGRGNKSVKLAMVVQVGCVECMELQW